uniref:Uncharacterized protein n=1 Tax=Candidatus Kentrum sp. FW TaxID=2126338 RepID=A0A450TRZ7_9GAMM|nr:MAG: hypothetical protein BECKFW1821B_GA0114236_12034 [Candidatus Kentron sp. FW]
MFVSIKYSRTLLNGHQGTSITPENESPLGWLGSSAASPQMFFHSNISSIFDAPVTLCSDTYLV